jgi:hypothetical protein
LTCKVKVLGRELTQVEQKKKERMAQAATAAKTELDRRQQAAGRGGKEAGEAGQQEELESEGGRQEAHVRARPAVG